MLTRNVYVVTREHYRLVGNPELQICNLNTLKMLSTKSIDAVKVANQLTELYGDKYLYKVCKLVVLTPKEKDDCDLEIEKERKIKNDLKVARLLKSKADMKPFPSIDFCAPRT